MKSSKLVPYVCYGAVLSFPSMLQVWVQYHPTHTHSSGYRETPSETHAAEQPRDLGCAVVSARRKVLRMGRSHPECMQRVIQYMSKSDLPQRFTLLLILLTLPPGRDVGWGIWMHHPIRCGGRRAHTRSDSLSLASPLCDDTS